jgi:hypothetical protein
MKVPLEITKINNPARLIVRTSTMEDDSRFKTHKIL